MIAYRRLQYEWPQKRSARHRPKKGIERRRAVSERHIRAAENPILDVHLTDMRCQRVNVCDDIQAVRGAVSRIEANRQSGIGGLPDQAKVSVGGSVGLECQRHTSGTSQAERFLQALEQDPI